MEKAPVEYSDLKPRLIAAAVLGTLAVVFLIWGGYAFAGFVAAGIFLMTQELLQIVKRDWSVPGVAGLAMAASGSMAILLVTVSPLAAVLAFVLGLAIAGMASRQSPNLVGGVGYLLIVLAGVAVVLLRFEAGGLWLVLWVILCVVAADVGGYFFGKTLQGPKFWPSVSPKKTWSGVLGGLFLTLLVALVYGWLSHGNITAFLLFGGLISIISVAGDLMESAIKRHYGVKDAGSILPGHGGLLDRFDGMTAVMVVFLVLTQLADIQTILGVSYVPPVIVGGGV